jgi:hypothetical protein
VNGDTGASSRRWLEAGGWGEAGSDADKPEVPLQADAPGGPLDVDLQGTKYSKGFQLQENFDKRDNL